ncbi:mediator of RNA polymerase II transcription subunit 15a isoform X2 [Physcomitrium patens]|uniref:Uncharacterized protein n=1 Tax=Physcomitrium patens TaxID=3218 RepID=A0A2K1JGV3_PHYPA|nr:uncharacterized protein LOC112290935 isoform X2 [Physcomitrium patens]PNR40795.1 hypothetical protein PHYPA_018198 [Physcomitrium patens]|eukprot:XP_024393549.1 uncharacterized protein LOC112290935 isoform X2 [Physcomitrella patens]
MSSASTSGSFVLTEPQHPVAGRRTVYGQLQELKKLYLDDMIELYSMLTARSNQPMPAEQLQKLKHYKDVLHRMIPYLRVPEDRVPKEFNADKVDAFEKQIVNIMETFKRRRQGVA